MARQTGSQRRKSQAAGRATRKPVVRRGAGGGQGNKARRYSSTQPKPGDIRYVKGQKQIYTGTEFINASTQRDIAKMNFMGRQTEGQMARSRAKASATSSQKPRRNVTSASASAPKPSPKPAPKPAPRKTAATAEEGRMIWARKYSADKYKDQAIGKEARRYLAKLTKNKTLRKEAQATYNRGSA
ncbi:hypothetical protein [Thermus thermophilus]|uniref:hypothetical protein n=1 Tax=Thermus thermophilus TaxID=274 RepID=UPI0013FDB172|nr:hypothetical protein [Thermus thermophilus]